MGMYNKSNRMVGYKGHAVGAAADARAFGCMTGMPKSKVSHLHLSTWQSFWREARFHSGPSAALPCIRWKDG